MRVTPVTTVTGDWTTSFALNLTYDGTPFSATYDWIGGFRASLRTTVRDGQGTLLGTVVTAGKGSSTFTNAAGTQQVTDNRNLVPANDVAFMDDHVIVLGPERAMVTVLEALRLLIRLPGDLANWYYLVRASLAVQTNQQQMDLWHAISDIETASINPSDSYHKFKVLADTDETTQGGWIEMQDCVGMGRCQQPSSARSWFPVDVVRSHYIIDHISYPEFFLHHRHFLSQIESWITDVGIGWIDSPTYGGTAGYNLSGATIVPYGKTPYWDSSVAIPDDGDSVRNFRLTPLPNGTDTWGNGRNCHTGSLNPSTKHGASGCMMAANGVCGRVDTALLSPPIGDPSCQWEASATFRSPTYALTYGTNGVADTSPTSWLCTAAQDKGFNPSAAGNQFMDFPDGHQMGLNVPQGTGTNSSCDCANTNYTENMGFFCFHGCVHTQLGWTYLPAGSQSFFGAFDSPASPVFFPWHAWVDHLYAIRVDCHGS